MSKTKYVVGFLFGQETNEVVLVLKNRPVWQAGKLNGIGGHVEPGESFVDAMTREFEEETGTRLANDTWKLFAILSGDNWTMHCFTASRLSISDFDCRETDVGEFLELVAIHEIPDAHTIPNLKWLIPMAMPSDAHNWPYNIVERFQQMERS